jgi:hypothetical protein
VQRAENRRGVLIGRKVATETLAQSGVGVDRSAMSAVCKCSRVASTVRSDGGSSKRFSSASWIRVPRMAAGEGASGRRSIDRRRKRSGQF